MFVDSSIQFYNDHGRGTVATIGEGYGGTVEAKSGRSKMNCRSTMEYELVELHQSLPAVLWIRIFLSDLGFPQILPSLVYEDNRAVIDIMKRGQVSSGVSRYIETKCCYARNLIERGMIKLVHCPTDIMLADILTKNLSLSIFNKLKCIIFNNNIVNDVYVNLINQLNTDVDNYLNNLIVNFIVASL